MAGIVFRRDAKRGPNLSLAQTAEIHRRANAGERPVDLAKRFGISANAVGRIKRGTPCAVCDLTRERHPKAGNARLRPDHVLEIRALASSATCRELAERFGVAQTTISRVIKDATWPMVGAIGAKPQPSRFYSGSTPRAAR